MNAQQIKDTIRKFKNADLSQVKDAKMRAKGEKLQAKQGGFTLLELLVVVGILAVIAGSVIASLDGKEERAAQSTAVHTMATLENGMKAFKATEKRVLPEQLESLICSAGMTVGANGLTLTAANLNANAGTAALLGNAGANSNVARSQGGLTADLAGALEVVSVEGDDPIFNTLNEAGLTSLRYATATICNAAVDASSIADDGTDSIDDVALVDLAKPNLVFRDPLFELDGADSEWEYGAGANVELEPAAATNTNLVPIAFHDEPAEIGAGEDDVVAVFGIGPDSSLTGNIIGRAPADGNAGPDKYGHFTLAVKVGSCVGGFDTFAADPDDANCTADEEATIVAVLDAGGDAYDDEIAEARGNEEE